MAVVLLHAYLLQLPGNDFDDRRIDILAMGLGD